jgi:hypothetical protein
MDKKIVAVLLVLIIANIAFTSCVAAGVFEEKQDEVYTLSIGMQDSKTHEEYDREKAALQIDKIVTKYCDGLTRYFSEGAWKYDDGSIGYEKSIVYILAGTDLGTAHKICDEVKQAFNQESVMITINKEKVEFY